MVPIKLCSMHNVPNCEQNHAGIRYGFLHVAMYSLHLALTSGCFNVYCLGNTQSIRYFTAIDSINSTSPPVQKYHTVTAGSVEIPQ